MIRRIRLSSFQCHKRLEINLDPKITTIVGSSDIGKSAIIRALAWAAFNNPSGTAFIRYGSNGCSVSILTDQHEIKRKRSKSVNLYEVDGSILEAFGRGNVPDKVMDALRLESLNFQFQHDSPLWMSQSAGQVAKELNQIVNLDLIDQVLDRLSKATKRIDSELTVSQNRLIAANSSKKQLEWIIEAQQEYAKIEEVQQQIDQSRTQHTQLEAVVQSALKTTKQLDKLKQLVAPARKELKQVEAVDSKLEVVQDQISRLAQLVQSAKQHKEQIANSKRQVKELQDKLASIEVCPLCERPM